MGAAENNYIFGSSLAFRTYLIDTIADKSGNVDGYQSLVPISSGVNQTFDSYTSGSSNELAFGWGGNVQDKLYLGASIVLPIVNFNRSLQVSETDLILANKTNQFGSLFSMKILVLKAGVLVPNLVSFTNQNPFCVLGLHCIPHS
jgi:hypothetical protein